MTHPHNAAAADKSERRKHWSDRRLLQDRRNLVRLQHTEFDCRREVPRRESDLTGPLDDGDIWWGDHS